MDNIMEKKKLTKIGQEDYLNKLTTNTDDNANYSKDILTEKK